MWPWHVRRWVSRWRSSAVEMRPRWWVVRAWRWIVRAWRRLVRRWPAVGVRLVAGRHGWVPHQSIVGASSSQFGRTWGRDSHRVRAILVLYFSTTPRKKINVLRFRLHTRRPHGTSYWSCVVPLPPPPNPKETPKHPALHTRPHTPTALSAPHCRSRHSPITQSPIPASSPLPVRSVSARSLLRSLPPPPLCRPPLPPRPHSMLRPPATGRGSSWAPPGLLKLLLRASRPERVPASCLRAGSAPWSPASARRS